MGVHTGLDAQAAGQTPFGDLNEIASLGLNVRVFCCRRYQTSHHRPNRQKPVLTSSSSVRQFMVLHHLLKQHVNS